MKQIAIQHRIFRLRGDDSAYFCTRAKVDYNLNVRGVAYVPLRRGRIPESWEDQKTWKWLPKEKLADIVVSNTSKSEDLSGPYSPAAEFDEAYNAYRMGILTPDSMDESTAEALRQLKQAVGNVTEFVAERLHYSLRELSECLALEQIDAVALAIYNAEARNQGLIIGDQTGIGKGRVAASFIRYAILHGHKPIFFTEKPGLFSDIYRDLCAIHSENFVPLIVNASGGDILDEEGNIVYRHKKEDLQDAIASGIVPDGYDFVCCTYSQMSTDDSNRKGSKCLYISQIAKDNIIVMDEAHNAGGAVEMHKTKDGELKTSGNTGLMFQTKILPICKGVMYLSATYAKFPKNMPIYAINTCISDLSPEFKKEALVKSLPEHPDQVIDRLSSVPGYFQNLPAQEMVSSAMARFGQFIRRERKTEGMTVDYITLDKEGADKYGVENLKEKHFAVFENVTAIIARIREFQEDYFVPYLIEQHRQMAMQGERGKNPPSIASASVFSTLFSLMNNILLSLKAEAIADRAIWHLSEGRKAVIAFAYTNESALNAKGNNNNPNGANLEEAAVGGEIKSDYSYIFERIFRGLLYYHVRENNKPERVDVSVEDLGESAVIAFNQIIDSFRKSTTGLCLSPIDVIRDKIERAGYKVAECTGREKRLEFKNGNYGFAKIGKVEKYSSEQGKHVTLCYNKFNNNEVDVLMINQSGSTGKSAHATNVGTRLKPEEVKQRVMIIGQAELDVNTEVQKRGRINRTGQFTHIPPLYEYIYSAIPCEKRFMMMLKAKLKSLDANTTSNQKQSSESVLEAPDFFNKYGDELVEMLLIGNEALNHTLNDPLGIEIDQINERKHVKVDEMARTTFGRMQVLSPSEQEEYFDTILSQYNQLVERLKAEDKFDLEVKELDFDAKLISESLLRQATSNDGTQSELTGSAFIGRYSIKSQAEYMKPKEVAELVALNKEKHKEVLAKLKDNYDDSIVARKEHSAEMMKKKIEEQKNRITRAESVLADFIDMDMSPDRIQAKKDQLKEEKEKLKELSSGKDGELEEYLERDRQKYNTLSDMIKKCTPGAVFNYEGDICIVIRVSVDDPSVADILSRPSAITVSIITTSNTNMIGSHSQYMPLLNMAETGMATLAQITEHSASIKDYENFVNNDNRRDEVTIVTGNIVPLLGANSGSVGSVITRFTMSDGTKQNGIVVKPVLKNGVLAMPEWAEMATISLNEKTIGAVMDSLTSSGSLSRVDFVSSVGSGEFAITADRDRSGFGGMRFRVVAGRGYRDFLSTEEARECSYNKIDGYDWKDGAFRGQLEDVKRFLVLMSRNDFQARVHFANLKQYADAVDLSKYKAKDWVKLGYIKSNIPADSSYTPRQKPQPNAAKKAIPSLLEVEIRLLGKSKKQPQTTGEWKIVDYSDRAWAVVGDTKPLMAKLKSLGGKYNRNLRGGAGWIISKRVSREELEQKLAA